MKNLIYYFYPKIKVSYFDKLKTLFFIHLCFFGIVLIFAFLISDLFFQNANYLISIYSKGFAIILLTASLFILKSKGIKYAGNLFSLLSVASLLFFINILPKGIDPIYKYLQGFYSIFAYLIIGLLFATRPIIIFNMVITLISTAHIYLYSLRNFDNTDLYTTAFIHHSTVLVAITVIIFYTNKFTELTINKANSEINYRKLQNQELLASEEEIRAANEELVATTDALVESNMELTISKDKAEESNRLKTEFLNNMSHEVRTPLNGILGFSQLLGISNLEKTEQNKYIDVIQKSGDQLLSIIDNIIEISKLSSNKVMVVRKQVNLHKMLSDLFKAFEPHAVERNLLLELNLEYENADRLVQIDAYKVHKILSVLLDNAIKFSEIGFVNFGYQLLESDTKIKFFVKDTGIGIVKDKHDSIFDKFSQAESSLAREYGGLGLGLAIAKEYTTLMEGEMTLESERGVGSVFSFTIPLMPIQPAEERESYFT